VARESRYAEGIERLREASRPDRPAPPELEPYLDKVRRHAYRVTDEDVNRLRTLGFTEDELFEHTVSAAAAAGLDRLDAALRALR
jgi:alkylhydroperoxidase family enzyme